MRMRSGPSFETSWFFGSGGILSAVGAGDGERSETELWKPDVEPGVRGSMPRSEITHGPEDALSV